MSKYYAHVLEKKSGELVTSTIANSKQSCESKALFELIGTFRASEHEKLCHTHIAGAGHKVILVRLVKYAPDAEDADDEAPYYAQQSLLQN
jgi:hypothetical protein